MDDVPVAALRDLGDILAFLGARIAPAAVYFTSADVVDGERGRRRATRGE